MITPLASMLASSITAPERPLLPSFLPPTAGRGGASTAAGDCGRGAAGGGARDDGPPPRGAGAGARCAEAEKRPAEEVAGTPPARTPSGIRALVDSCELHHRSPAGSNMAASCCVKWGYRTLAQLLCSLLGARWHESRCPPHPPRRRVESRDESQCASMRRTRCMFRPRLPINTPEGVILLL